MLSPPKGKKSNLNMSVSAPGLPGAMEAQSNSNVDGRKEGEREEEGWKKGERAHQQRNYYTVQCRRETLKKAPNHAP